MEARSLTYEEALALSLLVMPLSIIFFMARSAPSSSLLIL